jgi:hypothetical protein
MSKQIPSAPQVTLNVDGREITAPAGATVAAAMLGAGQRAWRTTRNESKPRGQFCGIGACWDCLVSVDGAQVQRACMLPVRQGMSISTQDPELSAHRCDPQPEAPDENVLATGDIAISVGPEPEPESPEENHQGQEGQR